ncbi:MAG: alpha/beta hydrolase [Chitinophagales bacterium]|nr:alpha/beta hydrolase [Chitinophagales bacterium]
MISKNIFDNAKRQEGQMAVTIYLIPGVGADERIFSKLQLPEECEVVHLRWVAHKPGEDLKSYVKRLLPQIKQDTVPVLIGMSFGGIVAIELAKIIHPYKTIIISSIKSRQERPLKFSVMRRLPIHRFIPGHLVARVNFWWNWVLGDLTESDKKLIQDMIRDINIPFNEWAADKAITWTNEEVPSNVVHIHGTNDTIFPHIYIGSDAHLIKGGTHWMIVNRAKEISKIIRKELSEKQIIKRVQPLDKAA